MVSDKLSSYLKNANELPLYYFIKKKTYPWLNEILWIRLSIRDVSSIIANIYLQVRYLSHQTSILLCQICTLSK